MAYWYTGFAFFQIPQSYLNFSGRQTVVDYSYRYTGLLTSIHILRILWPKQRSSGLPWVLSGLPVWTTEYTISLILLVPTNDLILSNTQAIVCVCKTPCSTPCSGRSRVVTSNFTTSRTVAEREITSLLTATPEISNSSNTWNNKPKTISWLGIFMPALWLSNYNIV